MTGGAEYKPKRGWLSRIPAPVKALAIKAWFGGAVFYFIGWGLFLQTGDQLDLTVALGLALGLVTDLLINRALVFMESGAQEYRRYLLCYSKRFFSLPVNLFYGLVLAFLISYTYHGINVLALQWNGRPPGYITLGSEPLLYGLFFMGYDMLFVSAKRLLVRLTKRKGE